MLEVFRSSVCRLLPDGVHLVMAQENERSFTAAIQTNLKDIYGVFVVDEATDEKIDIGIKFAVREIELKVESEGGV